jgi:hypothetical protein
MSAITPRKSGASEDGLGALSIRDVVESALEQEDIMPVVSEAGIILTYTIWP